MSRRFVHHLLLVAFGVAIGLGAAELALRLVARTTTPLAWKLRDWDPWESRLELLGASCYRARPGAVLPFPNGIVAHVNGLGYRGPEVAIPKPAGTYRVVLLGGSTSHGYLVEDDQTIDAHLRRAIDAHPRRTIDAPLRRAIDAPLRRAIDAHERRSVEVVNLGLEGLDAICDEERLRLEGLRLEPDAVVVHTGVNDVLALRFDRLAANDPARGFRAQQRRAEEARAHAHGAWAALKHLVFLARVPGIMLDLSARRPSALPGPELPSAVALDAFARTIRDLVALLPVTTTVLLSTPPTSIRFSERLECGARVVDAATTTRYRAALDGVLRRIAVELAASGRPVAYVPHAIGAAELLDDCHLTGNGNRQIAEDFAGVLAPSVLSGSADGGMRDAR